MNIRKYISMFAAVALLLPSCTELDLHYEGAIVDDEQAQAAVEANAERVNAAVSGMYAIWGRPLGFFGSVSHRADDCGYVAMALGQDLNSGDMVNAASDYDWFSVALEWSDRSPTYANPQLRLGLPYRVLYATKDVLDVIPDDTQSDDLKSKRGQAKAMRAFAYLSLAPYFQFKYKGNEDKPSLPMLKDGVDPRNNPRAPLRDLYAGIITDLTDAIADLNGFTRPNKGIIDKQVAYGFRARAYLYMEEWAKAAADADSAMAGYTPYGIGDLTAPGFYNAGDANWMWALLLPADVTEADTYTTLATWPSQLGSFSSSGYVAYGGIYRSINVMLYNKIAATDVRKAWWLDESKTSPYLEGLVWRDVQNSIDYVGQDIPPATITDVKEPMGAYANVKFGQRSGIGSAYNDGDWCMMRVEEMLLIKAEATAKAGDLGKGKQILEDFVKTYRDPAYTSTAGSVEAFSDEVWLQRRIELWGEGFAMADVMRLGKNVVRYHPGVTTNVTEAYRFNVASTDPWMLLRFVQREITNNPAILQNEGGTQPKQGDGTSLLDGVTD